MLLAFIVWCVGCVTLINIAIDVWFDRGRHAHRLIATLIAAVPVLSIVQFFVR